MRYSERTGAVRGRGAPGQPFAVVIAAVLVLSACSSGTVGVVTEVTRLEPSVCSGGFVAHDLDHITRGPNTVTTLFDGTGAGVGLADFNGDGLLDIALANLAGASTVLINEGNLLFEHRELIEGRFRHVAPIDLDADGRVDIALSTGVGIPILMRNVGSGFERQGLEGVSAVAYSLAWGM